VEGGGSHHAQLCVVHMSAHVRHAPRVRSTRRHMLDTLQRVVVEETPSGTAE
jgi:hypothetical protein